MLKRFLVTLALAVPTLWAVPAAAQTATDYARDMQSLVGSGAEGGIGVSAIAAEGNTLVITVDGPVGWREGLDPDQVSGALVGGFCETSPAFFGRGVTMRIDSYDNKKAYQKGPLITACPAPKQ